MSKIVQAVNSIIANRDGITEVIKGESETFFIYKGKYTWSMAKRPDGLWLWFYPGNPDPEMLAGLDGDDWEGVAMVSYKDADIGTREAKASFQELFTILSEMVFGVDKVLDDIIADGDL